MERLIPIEQFLNKNYNHINNINYLYERIKQQDEIMLKLNNQVTNLENTLNMLKVKYNLV